MCISLAFIYNHSQYYSFVRLDNRLKLLQRPVECKTLLQVYSKQNQPYQESIHLYLSNPMFNTTILISMLVNTKQHATSGVGMMTACISKVANLLCSQLFLYF
jgi:hypothetical protein